MRAGARRREAEATVASAAVVAALGIVDYGWAMCQAPLRKPSPVMSPGFLSFFQL